jgi:formylglycine-generating enzyme required for sulfatase activity
MRYPIHISRNRRWDGRVRLRTEQEIGRGFVHVPGGPFIQGGDEEIRGWCLPRSEPEVEDFYIAEFPVTMEEYLEFLNDVARESQELAARHAPRISSEEGSFLVRGGDGTYQLPEAAGGGGLRFHRRLPIIGISWLNAMAYCAWRSKKERRVVRLPSESEWQKAARGVDGRLFPWGNRFDPALCNMIDSRPEPALLPVEEFPADVSVYGVRGLGGNVGDWTAPEITVPDAALETDEPRLIAGGAWYLKDMVIRSANRFGRRRRAPWTSVSASASRVPRTDPCASPAAGGLHAGGREGASIGREPTCQARQRADGIQREGRRGHHPQSDEPLLHAEAEEHRAWRRPPEPGRAAWREAPAHRDRQHAQYRFQSRVRHRPRGAPCLEGRHDRHDREQRVDAIGHRRVVRRPRCGARRDQGEGRDRCRPR